MRIELDELEECQKCGNIFNYTYGEQKEQGDYGRTPYFEGKCPSCGKEYSVFL